MARNRTSSFWLVLWGALLFQGLKPLPRLEEWIARLLVPLRLAAEIGAPLGVLSAREASAAELALARTAEAEAREGAAVLARLAERALPRDPVLQAGRAFLAAEVLARPSKDGRRARKTEVPSWTPGMTIYSGVASGAIV